MNTGDARAQMPPLQTVPSVFGFDRTVERLEAAITNRGLTVFAKIDHAAGAARVDQSLRPTTAFIFGNPKVGTPVIQADQRAGLDLPMRILVMENEDGKVLMIYRQPDALSADWDVALGSEALVLMTKGLAAITAEAAGPE